MFDSGIQGDDDADRNCDDGEVGVPAELPSQFDSVNDEATAVRGDT